MIDIALTWEFARSRRSEPNRRPAHYEFEDRRSGLDQLSAFQQVRAIPGPL